MSPNIHTCNRLTCPPKNVTGPKVSCAKCQKPCFLMCFGFEKCGDNGVKVELPSNSCIAMDPNSICFSCPNCDSSFLTDSVNDKIHQTQETMQNVNKPKQLTETPKMKTTTPKMNNSTDTPITFAQLKNDITKMSKTLHNIAIKIDTSSSDVREIKAITTDTNAMVKAINTNSNELNNEVSSKMNEIVTQAQNTLSSQAQSFSSIVKQQNNEERKNIAIKRKLDQVQRQKL